MSRRVNPTAKWLLLPTPGWNGLAAAASQMLVRELVDIEPGFTKAHERLESVRNTNGKFRGVLQLSSKAHLPF